MTKLAPLSVARDTRNRSSGVDNVIDIDQSSTESNNSTDILELEIPAGDNVGRRDHREVDLHGRVNILLGGSMLSSVIIVLVIICYYCHKNIKKYQPQEYPQHWPTEADAHSLGVFTMDSHTTTCQEEAITVNQENESQAVLPCSLIPAPPPAYENLILLPRSVSFSRMQKCTEEGAATNETEFSEIALTNRTKEEESAKSDADLPSYEDALKLEAAKAT